MVFTGGGTGGHRMPLVAVYQALKQVAKPEILYIGEAADCKSNEIRELGIKTEAITAGKLRRYFSWQNFSDSLRVVKGYFQARQILREYAPQVVFSKGGYVSVPVVRAAASLHIPVITHESDVVVGLANKLNASLATKICTAYSKEYYRSLPNDKIVKTGNLIRSELIKAANSGQESSLIKVGGRTVFTDKPLLLILGGSQGAHRINELVSSLLATLVDDYRVVHQTGEGDAEWLQQKRLQLGVKEQRSYFPIPFLSIEELSLLLKRSSIIISRAGSMISELALFAKPTILIPLSNSAGGHQYRNARLYENKGAAIVLSEKTIKPTDLLKTIKRITEKDDVKAKLVAGMKLMRDDDGANKVARIIIKNAK